ncbi:winged helix-turn-helix domain-containing protein [Phytomonospora endophytica]|uniref:DNA-binding transcriptional ArsR family regulator n=1 Tax=Phytomonospora endophytica TaxID=714109 RepID=A0A841FNT4_9ACTN|nr:helix-turn-helix domain-containing protein [Phytomonospora endophytica]MBB6034249.1 DNA-binding transcriptional ArsR family regulator [Phytomonospora endophytica]GIG66641.1 transcriptional regulator [Phytomonospora endophytica]
MEKPTTVRVGDAAALRAVTHPLRARMLGSLRVDGPATASELGRRFGESSGTTSYHLRLLEKFGFIELDPEQPNARDKRWRALHMYTGWSNVEAAKNPALGEAVREMNRRQLNNVVEATAVYEGEKARWGDEWAEVSGHGDHAVRLTPDEAQELRDRITALVHEYHDRRPEPAGTEMVRLFVALFPVDDDMN